MPVFEKSPAAIPVTASENVIVYVKEVAFVGDDCAEVNDTTDGAVVSIAMSLVSAMFAPAGSVVDVIAFPAVSSTVPTVYEETVRSDVVWLAPTV